MPFFPELTEEEFQSKFPVIHDEIIAEFGAGFVPRFFRVVAANNPELAETLWRLIQDTLLRGRLPRVLKEMVLIAVAHKKGCPYCVTAHYVICCRLGVRPQVLDAFLLNLEALRPNSTKEMVALALTLVEGSVDQAVVISELTRLRVAGVQIEELHELVAMAACADLFAVLATGLLIEPDAAFVEFIRLVKQT